MATEYDLAEIIGESVPSLTAKFADMSDAQLHELHDMETAGGRGRSGVLSAIKAELSARPAGESGADESEDGLNGAFPTFEQLQDLCKVQADKIKKLEAALADAKARLEGAPPSASNPAHDEEFRLKVNPKVKNLGRVVFGDGRDMVVTTLPGLHFEKDAFAVGKDGALVLNQPISFPLGVPSAEVHSAWLIGDEGRQGRVCRLMAPLPVGGGASAEIPAGNLVFRA